MTHPLRSADTLENWLGPQSETAKLARALEDMKSAASAALERLDASRFTNAEHARAKTILRTPLKGHSHD